MRSPRSNHAGATILSVMLHAAIIGALSIGFDFRSSRTPLAASRPAIEAVVVDQSIVDREVERVREREQAAIRERERVATEQREREAREQAAAQAERQRVERERLAAAELQRQTEQAAELAAAEAARQERERVERERREREAAEAERQRREEEARREAERVAEVERQREVARRQAEEEARQRAQAERELQEALEAEAELNRLRNSGELDKYRLQIRARIEASWIPPASATAGLECTVNVTQIPSGDVVAVSVGRCNGDDAVRRSIEQAVLRASPLPRPAIAALFERNLELVFKPDF